MRSFSHNHDGANKGGVVEHRRQITTSSMHTHCPSNFQSTALRITPKTILLLFEDWSTANVEEETFTPISNYLHLTSHWRTWYQEGWIPPATTPPHCVGERRTDDAANLASMISTGEVVTGILFGPRGRASAVRMPWHGWGRSGGGAWWRMDRERGGEDSSTLE